MSLGATLARVLSATTSIFPPAVVRVARRLLPSLSTILTGLSAVVDAACSQE